MIMTAEMLLAAMLSWKCHTMVVDVPERRETIVQTVCIKVIVEPPPPPAVAEKKPAVKKPVKYRYASRKKKRRTARR